MRKVVDKNGEPRVVYHGTDRDFTDNPQIVIVDDTWTRGQMTVSGMDAILRANPNADVRAITTLASGRNGKHVKPTEKQLTSVLEKSSSPSVDALNDFLGYDIRRATGSELHGYVLNGRSGPDGIRERFGAPGVGRQNESGSGLDHGGAAGTAEETERGAGVAPDSVASRNSFTPIGAGLANESIFAGLLAADYVSGKNRGDETYERLRRALHVVYLAAQIEKINQMLRI